MAQLEKMDPDLYIDRWVMMKLKSGIETMDFLTAGKAIRILLRVLGNPCFCSPWLHAPRSDMSGKPLKYRAVIWALAEMGVKNQIQAAEELEKAGIKDFYISPGNYFTIHIPYEAYYSAFTTSDDPKVWEQRQASRTLAAEKLKQKKLKEEERHAKWAEESKEWQVKHQKEQEEAKKKKQEQEYLASLGKVALEQQEKLKQIKVDDVEVKRGVNLSDGHD